MSLAQNYRSNAARYAELVAATRSLKDGSRYRKLAASYAALADNEDWLAGTTNEPASR
jgi:hypothetical protein